MSVANKIGVVDDSYKKRTEEFRTLNYSNLEISFTVDLANYSRHDDLHVTTPTQLLVNERTENTSRTSSSQRVFGIRRTRPSRPDSLLVHLLQGTNGSAGSIFFSGPGAV